jgi:serine phosphatase RsbU (regulator of sigma subunit)
VVPSTHTPPDPLSTAGATARVLADAAAVSSATTAGAVQRAAVEAACRLTPARRGLAALYGDGAAVTSEWYDSTAGWQAHRRSWPVEGSPGGASEASGPLVLRAEDAAGAFGDGVQPAHAAAAPLVAQGRRLGFLAVAGDGAFGDDDLATLYSLARLAAHRLHDLSTDKRYLAEYCSTQAEIADRLQRKLLPQEPPQLEGLDVAFSYRSASAGVLSGGDFVDFYSRSPGTLAFAIGDVAGKGVDAMAVTFVTKYVLRAAVQGGQLSWPTHPGEALQELRTALLEQPDFGAEEGRFVTVLFGTLSPARGLLQLASAGHPTPFIVRRDRVERPLLLTEPAIGVELGAALAAYPEETVELRAGDVVVFSTDGLTELRDADDAYFEDAMSGVLDGWHDTPAAEVVERLMRAGEAFSARPPADDLAVLCIHYTAAPEVHL